MADLLREAPLGQLIRWASGNRFLKYPEEFSGFKLPAAYNNVLNSANKEEAVAPSSESSKPGAKSSGRSSSDETSLVPVDSDFEKKVTAGPSDQLAQRRFSQEICHRR